jgi:hypothetical protein
LRASRLARRCPLYGDHFPRSFFFPDSSLFVAITMGFLQHRQLLIVEI